MEEKISTGTAQNYLYITTNYNCNLDCIYCYEKGKRHNQTFSLSNAKKILSDFLNKDMESHHTIIDFNGGEPFLVFDQIRALCEWAWDQNFKHKYLFYATSNGTLIHDHIKEWLFHNRNRFWVGLSIDGTKEMHDLNRSNSFDHIDIDFFSTTWPDQSVKMTLSPKSIPYLYEGLIFLHSKFNKITCNFAQLIDWGEDDFLHFERELEKTAEYYISNPEIAPCSLVFQSLHKILDDSEPSKWCGVGTSMKVYDINGNEYPCHLFFESISDRNSEENVFSIDFTNRDKILDPICNCCPIVKLCPTCYGANFVATGNIANRNKQYCKFYISQVKFSCLIEYSKIKSLYENNFHKGFSDLEKYYTVRKMEAIYSLMQRI